MAHLIEWSIQMKTRASPPHAMRTVIERVREKASDVEMLIRELAVRASRLGDEIAAEEKRTRIGDPSHVAYSFYAKALTQRRDNLLISIEELQRAEFRGAAPVPRAARGTSTVIFGAASGPSRAHIAQP
jgi:hypothetical protein